MGIRTRLGILGLAGSLCALGACSSSDGGSTTTDGGAAAGGSGGTGNAANGGGGTAAGGTAAGGTAAGGTSAGGTAAGGTSAGGSGNPGDPEPPEMNGMTAAHNAARANVNPPAATPIPQLGWSSTVAAVAQAYANNCVFKHSQGSYGENLYASTNDSTPQKVVDSWMAEEPSYDYASNTCSDICGHYTQVVWAKSLKLGCGVANCNQNSPFGSGSWQLWVCNYDPPGNYNGEKPY